jgi:hypothetical protein
VTGMSRPALPASDEARVETVLVRGFVLLRLGGLAEIGLVLSLDWDHYRARGMPNLLLAGVVTAESFILMTMIRRRRSVERYWVGGDVLFLLACLAAGAAVTSPAYAHTWVYFMYPFTVITCYAIGIAFRPLWSVIGVTTVLSMGYAASAVIIHHEVLWNVLPNAFTYFANTTIAWVIARELRRSARSADQSRAEALARAAMLARERERARHARLLHDHVLQTLESLAATRLDQRRAEEPYRRGSQLAAGPGGGDTSPGKRRLGRAPAGSGAEGSQRRSSCRAERRAASGVAPRRQRPAWRLSGSGRRCPRGSDQCGQACAGQPGDPPGHHHRRPADRIDRGPGLRVRPRAGALADRPAAIHHRPGHGGRRHGQDR